MLVGDLILDEPEPDRLFDCARSTLAQASVLAGHVEVPHTWRGKENSRDVPAPPADPRNLEALGRAGFHVATLAGNHISDSGPNGIADTIEALHAQGIQTAGAGMNLAEARKPAVLNRGELRFGFLSYNCVGPRESWATSAGPGCAYVRILTHYELEFASPGGPPNIFTFADPASLEELSNDVAQLRKHVDFLVVALHKGVTHSPSTLGMYERPVAKAAIDAGADIVVGHHAHILQAVEVYRGKPIFHGLGNFVTVTRALSVEANSSPARLKWAQQRRKLFGFEPDPAYPTYPFHPEAKSAMIAFCDVDTSGVLRAGFHPCWIQPDGSPQVLGDCNKGREVAAYIEKISHTCGISTAFRWQDNRVLFLDSGK